MPQYSYAALTKTGEQVAASAAAASLTELAARLAVDGQSIRSARELSAPIPPIRGVPYLEVTGFYRQAASALAAGLPVPETLSMLTTEARNPKLRSLLYFLGTLVQSGNSLSEAMGRFPFIFPAVHIAMVRSGEESGNLGQALESLADQSEALSNMSRRFASSLVYPTVIACAALGLFGFGFLAIVPRFQSLFGDLGITDYPTPTKLVFFLVGKAFPVLGLLALGVAALLTVFGVQRKAATGRLWADTWQLRVPVLGQIVEKAAMARFASILGLLLKAGVDLPAAVRLSAQGAGNALVERLLSNAASEIEKGRTLSEAVQETGAMPPTLAWRIGVSEETGDLPDSMSRLGSFYMSQVDNLVTAASGLLEPLLIIFIGSGVGLLVLGMFLPLVAIIQNLSGGGG